MKIFCCGCQDYVEARLTNGAEIYPHRSDLHELPFWKCDACGNYVGCHHKTNTPTKPLGFIATPEIRRARQKIHKLIDPIWKEKRLTRTKVYRQIARRMGLDSYNTSKIRTIEEARDVYRAGLDLIEELNRRDNGSTR